MLLSKSLCNIRQILFVKNNVGYNQIFNFYHRNLSISSRYSNNVGNNTTPSAVDNKIEGFYLPEPPTSSDLLESIDSSLVYNHLGEATFQSLGLNSNWPTGWVQAGLEYLHVNFDLPWWSVIALSAIIVRTVMFPFTVKIRKLNMKSRTVAPLIADLQKKIDLAKISNDMVTATKTVRELEVLIMKSDYKPYKSAIYPMLQIPPFLAIMMGIRQMTSLPVASLQTGGMLWFTDLTMCDPYYVLPVTTMFLLLLQMEIGADFNKQMASASTKWAMRAIPFVGILLTCNFPAAMLVYWWCSSILSLTLTSATKIPYFKGYLGLDRDELYEDFRKPTKTQGFFKEWKKSNAEKRTIQMAKNAASQDNERWIKAGTEPIPQTFKYDPTKVKANQVTK